MKDVVKIYKINKCINRAFFDNIKRGRIGDGETCYVHLYPEKYDFDLVIDFDFTYELLFLGQNIVSHKEFRKELVTVEHIWTVKSFRIHAELIDIDKSKEIKSYSSIQFSTKFQKYWNCDLYNWAGLLKTKTAIIHFMKDESLLL